MTISINKIDIFNTTKDIITIPVNMVGVMGAGLGGLNPEDIRQLIYKYFQHSNIDVELTF